MSASRCRPGLLLEGAASYRRRGEGVGEMGGRCDGQGAPARGKRGVSARRREQRSGAGVERADRGARLPGGVAAGRGCPCPSARLREAAPGGLRAGLRGAGSAAAVGGGAVEGALPRVPGGGGAFLAPRSGSGRELRDSSAFTAGARQWLRQDPAAPPGSRPPSLRLHLLEGPERAAALRAFGAAVSGCGGRRGGTPLLGRRLYVTAGGVTEVHRGAARPGRGPGTGLCPLS